MRALCVGIFLTLGFFGSTSAEGATLTIAWNANSEPDLKGYIVSYGTTSRQYTTTVDVGLATTHTLTVLPGVTYYIAVQAYNQNGLSPYSSEVSGSVAAALSVTSLTANKASPQPVGTAVTFAASAAGGTSPYQFKFWVINGSTQTVARTWSTSNTFTWTPTVAGSNYVIRVWARNASSTVDAPDSSAATLDMSFVVASSATQNVAPTVSAGADRSVTLPNSVSLAGTVSDDGRPNPPGTTTSSWSRVSGPGTVTFSSPNAATTSASFSVAGTYVLRLTVSDSALSASDDVSVSVASPGGGPSSGLVAAYGFNESSGSTVQDISSNGLTGTINGAARTTQGRFGSALTFDGVNDWVTVADAAPLDLTTAMTLEAWVFPTAVDGRRDVVVKEGTVDIYNLYARNRQGQPEANAFVGSTNRWARGPELTPNVWSHLAATYDGVTIRLYVNGVQAGSTSISGSIGTSNGVLRIGGNSMWGEFFQGRIDEVRVYSRALSAAEIQADMNTPIGATSSDTTPPVLSGAQPTGALAAGTTQATLRVTTNEAATCRFGTTSGTLFSSLPTVFSTTGGTSHSGLVTGLAAGNYAFYVRCQDAAGNVNTSDFPIAFSVATASSADTVLPVVSMTAPTGGSTVSGAVTVTATASDNVGVAGVQFLLDGSPIGAEDTASPYTISWNSAGTTNGTHSLSARARDAAGNTRTATAVSVTVNNLATGAGLVAAYSFNAGSGTTTVNATGTGLNGTISGATWTSQGRFGSALSFDGVNDLVTIADANALDLTTGMTLEAWVYPTAGGGAWRNVLMKERAGGEVYNLYANSPSNVPTVYVIRAEQTGTPLNASGTAALALNTWSHLAATFDGATLRLYINGVQAGSRAISGALLTSTGALRIGGNSVWGEYFQGRIDEVRVYNRALSAAEIQTDMATAVQP